MPDDKVLNPKEVQDLRERLVIALLPSVPVLGIGNPEDVVHKAKVLEEYIRFVGSKS